MQYFSSIHVQALILAFCVLCGGCIFGVSEPTNRRDTDEDVQGLADTARDDASATPDASQDDASTTPDVPTPIPQSCQDNKKNGDETDVDCGGTSCPGCAKGAKCQAASDCAARSEVGEWSTCEPANNETCSSAGVKFQKVTSATCNGDKVCAHVTEDVSKPCVLDVEGTECAPFAEGSWTDCTKSEIDPCSTAGHRERVNSSNLCQSGTCTLKQTDEQETCEVETDGQQCTADGGAGSCLNGECCKPNCNTSCSGAADGCGGTCSNESGRECPSCADISCATDIDCRGCTGGCASPICTLGHCVCVP
ncbi:MAG: hypothetical protein H0U74_02810 [Bradymonadaceae bacterium]|nr:hypothetical protein [Lujinxingiaceae bacterium]